MILNRQHIGRIFPSFGVINPLGFYCFRAFSRAKSVLFHVFNYCRRLARPAPAKHPITKKFFVIENEEGLTKGAPLDNFNSIFKFRFCSFFTHKYNFVWNKTKVIYSNDIYNLSVKNDESYITKIGIVHNCRCTTKSYEDGEMPVTEILSTVENKTSVHPVKIDRQFRFNSGKKGIIFSPYHPYFTDVPKEMRNWATNNFGLPMVKNIPGYGTKI